VGGLTGAWLAGTGIVAWREVRASGHMPVPGALAGVTGLFLVLHVIAEAAPQSRQVVTLLGWGLDLAGLFKILPEGLFGQIAKTQASEVAAEGKTGAVGGTGQAAGSTTAGGRGSGA
jgi:hypothetical protein